MPSFLSLLEKTEQQTLLHDLNYLNMAEIKAFCKKHTIPFVIYIETVEGGVKKTSDTDRKGVILNRIRHYLKTGDLLPATRFPVSVVCFEELSGELKSTDKLFYGQYNKNNEVLMNLLKELTNGKFKDGAVARVLLVEYWTNGAAPTLHEFSKKWLQTATDAGKPAPEYAYLSDLAGRRKIDNWKEYRSEKAKTVLKFLNAL